MCTESHLLRQRQQQGISLVELIMFIVIVSLGIVGILSVMNVTTKASADPMLRKQALSIAESLLEEIQLQAFTFCDPADANASTSLSQAGCASTAQAPTLGPKPNTESRYNEPRFNNVGDYHGFTMTGIKDLQNTAVTGLGGYTATVNMLSDGASFGLAADEVLQINVTVTTGSTSVLLSAYRFRYAPRALP
ncbi:type IV pilus modification PilV family protein [Undibacterium sp. Ren11W]|uniref:type IV pilus modification PilV family protein n=1 Tax=Undibacterium sp. Ren11W TaxID=3413045 RepID=UPI003BF43BA4